MANESRPDNAGDEPQARPLWLQLAFGLLMGAAALIVLMVLLSRLG